MELSLWVKYGTVNNNLVGCWKGEVTPGKWLAQCIFLIASIVLAGPGKPQTSDAGGWELFNNDDWPTSIYLHWMVSLRDSIHCFLDPHTIAWPSDPKSHGAYIHKGHSEADWLICPMLCQFNSSSASPPKKKIRDYHNPPSPVPCFPFFPILFFIFPLQRPREGTQSLESEALHLLTVHTLNNQGPYHAQLQIRN